MSNERFNLDEEAFPKLDFKLLYVSTSKYEGDWQSLPHTHYFTELFYVLRGKGNFLVEEYTATVREHDLIIVNPHVEHTEMSLDSQPLEYIVFGVEGLTLDFGSSDASKGYGLFNDSADKKLFQSFSQIILREITEKQASYEQVCKDILDMMLIYLTRYYKLSLVPASSSRMTRECAIAKRYLDTNYAQNITLDSLAEATHINKYYLAHTFTNFLGMSPINYLIQKRLQVATGLLTSTNHSIADIASSSGFVSQSYFSQIFKKFTGVTPLQYRKQHNSSRQ